MIRYLLPLALAASLSACATRPVSVGEVITAAPSKVDQAERDYLAAKSFVDMIEPLLPAARVAQIRVIEAKIESAIALARQASSIAEQIRALADAAKATAELNGAPNDAAAQ